MSRNGAVTVAHVWKRFRPDRRRVRASDQLAIMLGRLRGEVRLPWAWALRDIDFVMEPGESLGLVGANGSGKSTLLKILSRVMYPYAGRVEAKGRVGALIEVATGLHAELSGRENVFLYGSLLGLNRRDVARRFDDIVGFAELDQAVDRQVKHYSSGMKMRLGFGVAAFLEPDVLLVDEVLAVGDASFQQRCLARMREVLDQGTTLIYVSHDLPTIEATCARSVWLERGVVRADGSARDVLGRYRRAVEAGAELEVQTSDDLQLVKVSATGDGDGPPHSTEPLVITVVLDSRRELRGRLLLGVTEGPGTPILLATRDVLLETGNTELECRIEELPLPRGRFYVWIAVYTGKDETAALPWGPAAQFDVVGPDLESPPVGIVRLAPVYAATSWEVREPANP